MEHRQEDMNANMLAGRCSEETLKMKMTETDNEQSRLTNT